jgi:hypothetical protein
MDKSKKELFSSPSRDEFKRFHKELPGDFYATDIDFCFVGKYPQGIIAILDYKKFGETVKFSEVIAYNELMKSAPIYIVKGENPAKGPFEIVRYLGGDPRPEPPVIKTELIEKVSGWDEFGKWEENLRLEYKNRGGWKGNFKTQRLETK